MAINWFGNQAGRYGWGAATQPPAAPQDAFGGYSPYAFPGLLFGNPALQFGAPMPIYNAYDLAQPPTDTTITEPPWRRRRPWPWGGQGQGPWGGLGGGWGGGKRPYQPEQEAPPGGPTDYGEWIKNRRTQFSGNLFPR